MAPFAIELGPEVALQFGTAQVVVREWHDRVAEDYTRGFDSPLTSRGQRAYDDALRSIAVVDSAITRATDQARDRIEKAEETGLSFALVLGLMSVVAATAAIALGAALRRFAAEAERKREEATAALAASSAANEARSRLLRGITHDVKNPLGAAKGYIELLGMGLKGPLAPEQVPLVQGVERTIDSALSIISELLDLARLESGGVRVERVETDLKVLVREAVADFEAAARTAGHVIADESSASPVLVYSDPVRVRQIVDNLLSNAIKYTPPPGRIAAGAELAGDQSSWEDGAWAVIRVSDTGPGIPPDQREAIFDEFSRLDESSSTKGHGLGLAVARGLARQLDGDLVVAESTQGAEFVLRLPRRRPTSSRPDAALA